ncbi:DUF2235 domain-containing protein [Xanthomonas oryzae pv. oryzae]|nr:DUF2235 domain-containing protein [Xanthomonas oryzae pv. oryzae]
MLHRLALGFFFDGTNNNFQRDQPKKAHSNVARLYDIFEADFEKPEFVGRYAAGVGTRSRTKWAIRDWGSRKKPAWPQAGAARRGSAGRCSSSWTISIITSNGSTLVKR